MTIPVDIEATYGSNNLQVAADMLHSLPNSPTGSTGRPNIYKNIAAQSIHTVADVSAITRITVAHVTDLQSRMGRQR